MVITKTWFRDQVLVAEPALNRAMHTVAITPHSTSAESARRPSRRSVAVRRQQGGPVVRGPRARMVLSRAYPQLRCRRGLPRPRWVPIGQNPLQRTASGVCGQRWWPAHPTIRSGVEGMGERGADGRVRVFICYRHVVEDVAHEWLYSLLAADLGADNVFRDRNSIRPGEDFIEIIIAAVDACDALLVLIGPLWSTLSDEGGQRRLDDPQDFVRLEIEAALERNVVVIPVLVGGARMPTAAVLPSSIAALARRQWFTLRPRSFKDDTVELVRHLRQIRRNRAQRQERYRVNTSPPRGPGRRTGTRPARGRPRRPVQSSCPTPPGRSRRAAHHARLIRPAASSSG